MAKSGNDESVTRDYRGEERPAAGRSFHLVLGGDVVLNEEWDTVKWSTDEASSTFGVEGGGDAEEVGIHLEYCALVWSGVFGLRFRKRGFMKRIVR